LFFGTVKEVSKGRIKFNTSWVSNLTSQLSQKFAKPMFRLSNRRLLAGLPTIMTVDLQKA
jgi:hypothetical protein